MNRQVFRGDYSSPLLGLPQEGHTNTSCSYDPEWNVYDTGENTTVRVVINNNSPFYHVRLYTFLRISDIVR